MPSASSSSSGRQLTFSAASLTSLEPKIYSFTTPGRQINCSNQMLTARAISQHFVMSSKTIRQDLEFLYV